MFFVPYGVCNGTRAMKYLIMNSHVFFSRHQYNEMLSKDWEAIFKYVKNTFIISLFLTSENICSYREKKSL